MRRRFIASLPRCPRCARVVDENNKCAACFRDDCTCKACGSVHDRPITLDFPCLFCPVDPAADTIPAPPVAAE